MFGTLNNTMHQADLSCLLQLSSSPQNLTVAAPKEAAVQETHKQQQPMTVCHAEQPVMLMTAVWAV